MQEDLFIADKADDSAAKNNVPQGPALELKGSSFTLPILQLMSTDIAAIEATLRDRIRQSSTFFEHAAVVVDVSLLTDEQHSFEFERLAELMRQCDLVPVGVRGAAEEQHSAVIAAGMAILKGGSLQALQKSSKVNADAAVNDSSVDETSSSDIKEYKTLVIEQPVRSGQQIYARGADLVVLGPVNAGAEVIADGSIHVYGALRGRAIAGATGSETSRVFAQMMAPDLVSIAGHYQIFEEHLPDGIDGKAGQVFLEQGKLNFQPLSC